MATEYKLSYTASDINSKLGQIDNLAKKSEVPTKVSDLIDDSDHRTVTDTEKAAWNAKSNFSGNYNDLTNKPTIPSTDGLATESYVDSAIAAIPPPDMSSKQDKITGTAGQFVVIGDNGAQPIDADVARTSMGAMKAKANIFTITASTTLDFTHTESLLRVNSSNAVTITIPLNSSVAFAIGSCITITKIGTGDVTISPSTGVTLNSKDSARTIDGQFSAVTLYKVATDEWDMWGALA